MIRIVNNNVKVEPADTIDIDEGDAQLKGRLKLRVLISRVLYEATRDAELKKLEHIEQPKVNPNQIGGRVPL
jgi:hypothetical protein